MKSLLLLLTAFLTGAATCHAEIEQPTSSPPNILFLIADDWGAHNELYGVDWIRTPGFNRIAQEGLLFKNAFTPNAKCAPSRATILTGRYSWQLEEAGNHLAYFPAKFVTWPECLAANGWNVGFTGKGWGPGIAKDSTGKPRQLTGTPYQKQKSPPVTTGIAPNDYAANFEEFLNKSVKSDQPWCFWAGFMEPHRKFEFGSGIAKGVKKIDDIDRVPKYWPDTDVIRTDMLDYAHEVEYLDTHVVKMLDALENRGLSDNTLVIVTSDHGMAFPRCKGFAYRDSNHIPLAIRWPKGIQNPGRVIEDFVSFVDIAPTLLAASQLDAPDANSMQPMSGTDWNDLFQDVYSGAMSPNRDHALVCKERNDVGRPNDWGYPIRGIITDSFLYLENREPSRWPSGNPETGYLDTDGSPTKSYILEMGRKNRDDAHWQLCFGMRPSTELYDLKEDPDCVENIVNRGTFREIRATLHQKLHHRLSELGDPRSSNQIPLFDSYQVTAGSGFYERWLRGERPPATWVEPSDFEASPIAQKPLTVKESPIQQP